MQESAEGCSSAQSGVAIQLEEPDGIINNEDSSLTPSVLAEQEEELVRVINNEDTSAMPSGLSEQGGEPSGEIKNEENSPKSGLAEQEAEPAGILKNEDSLATSSGLGEQEGEPSGVLNNEDNSATPSGLSEQEGEPAGVLMKTMKKKVVDDDSWMPEGWVKKEFPRPLKGKFPGYVDKKFYAPGVKRAFRSRTEALRYIEKLKKDKNDGRSSTGQ